MKKNVMMIVGIVLAAIGLIGLLGLFSPETSDKWSLAVGSIFFLVVGGVVAWFGWKRAQKAKAAPTEAPVQVIVTKNGKRYHSSPYCPSITDNSFGISLEEAKRRGYTPCEKCKFDF